jgi:hypothetical protein
MNRRELVKNIAADPDGAWTVEQWLEVWAELEYFWDLIDNSRENLPKAIQAHLRCHSVPGRPELETWLQWATVGSEAKRGEPGLSGGGVAKEIRQKAEEMRLAGSIPFARILDGWASEVEKIAGDPHNQDAWEKQWKDLYEIERDRANKAECLVTKECRGENCPIVIQNAEMEQVLEEGKPQPPAAIAGVVERVAQSMASHAGGERINLLGAIRGWEALLRAALEQGEPSAEQHDKHVHKKWIPLLGKRLLCHSCALQTQFNCGAQKNKIISCAQYEPLAHMPCVHGRPAGAICPKCESDDGQLEDGELKACPLCESSAWQPGLHDSPNQVSRHFDVVCRGEHGYCRLMNWAMSLDIWQRLPRQSAEVAEVFERQIGACRDTLKSLLDACDEQERFVDQHDPERGMGMHSPVPSLTTERIRKLIHRLGVPDKLAGSAPTPSTAVDALEHIRDEAACAVDDDEGKRWEGVLRIACEALDHIAGSASAEPSPDAGKALTELKGSLSYWALQWVNHTASEVDKGFEDMKAMARHIQPEPSRALARVWVVYSKRQDTQQPLGCFASMAAAEHRGYNPDTMEVVQWEVHGAAEGECKGCTETTQQLIGEYIDARDSAFAERDAALAKLKAERRTHEETRKRLAELDGLLNPKNTFPPCPEPKK